MTQSFLMKIVILAFHIDSPLSLYTAGLPYLSLIAALGKKDLLLVICDPVGLNQFKPFMEMCTLLVLTVLE